MIAMVAFKLNEIMPWIMERVVIFTYKQVTKSRPESLRYASTAVENSFTAVTRMWTDFSAF